MNIFRKSIVFTLIGMLLLSGISFADGTATSGADNLLKYGFIAGSDGDLMLGKALTRAEVAVLIAEMKGKKQEAAAYTKISGFSDVPVTAWYAPYIAYGKANGYFKGGSDGTYKPDSPVSAQEFAAFMMNALGYSGDYNYNSVLSFAATKNIYVRTKGYAFVRGDAFEALWETVNQPPKGSEISLGVTLGKLKAIPKVDETKPVTFTAKQSSANSFTFTFSETVKEPENYSVQVTKMLQPIALSSKWNDARTVLTLQASTSIFDGYYELKLTERQGSTQKTYEPISLKVEKERIDKVLFQSDTLSRYDAYKGSIKFNTYNQYGEDITNSSLGRKLSFNTSTNPSNPTVDYTNGIVTLQQGSTGQSMQPLSSLPSVTVIAYESTTGFSTSTNLKISQGNDGIREVRINGIIDSYGFSSNLVYKPGKTYYLDVSLIDTYGNIIRSASAINLSANGQEILMVNSMNEPNITLIKTAHPTNSNDVAYQIVFNTVPVHNSQVAFRAIAPFATQNSSAFFMATVVVE